MISRLMLALAPAVLTLATAAVAQPAASPPRMHEAHGPEMKARHEAMRKQHVEDLKTVLRLRPDQEAALAAFVAAHEPKTVERKPPAPAATTPERLEAMARHEAEMRAHHDQMRQAMAKFYAALSPEQQKVFDALHRLKGHGGPGGPMMMHRQGMMMGPGGGPHVMRHGPMDGPAPPR